MQSDENHAKCLRRDLGGDPSRTIGDAGRGA